MVALSALLDTPIRTPDGEEIGQLYDVILHTEASPLGGASSTEAYPPVAGITTSGLEPAGGGE